MTTFPGVISYPVPAYANVPIHSDYYQPSRFVITAITESIVTTITTSVDHNYVIGQIVRIVIPVLYGARQLNGMQGTVLSIPSTTQIVVNIDSSFFDPFIANPITAVITGASQASNCVLTCSNSFKTGNFLKISSVSGMTELNGLNVQAIMCNSTTIVLNISSLAFTAYTMGGIATLVTKDYTEPQVMAIGDYNSGILSVTGNVIDNTNIPGSFINISP